MKRRPDLLREVPPTAGLPLVWRDLLPGGPALDQAMAGFLGIAETQIECSGTAALIVALTTLSRSSPRRVVVIPAYTCPLVPLAIRHCGLSVRLCDLAPNGFDLDPLQLKQRCADDTLAVIPTHLAGRVADVQTALEIAHGVGASVIEDAAQALGAKHKGQSVGLIGDIGFFSLAAGKGLSIYEGGVLVARDPALRAALRRTSKEIIPGCAHWEMRRCVELLAYVALYRPSGLRYAYGLPLRRALRRGDWVGAVGDDFSVLIPLHRVGRWRSTVGARALTRLADFQSELRQLASRRIARLQQMGVQVLTDTQGNQGTWPFLMVMMPSVGARDCALQTLWSAGLGVSRLFIHALPDYGYLADCVPAADVPQARDFAGRTLTISNSPWLDDAGFEQIISVLEKSSGQ